MFALIPVLPVAPYCIILNFVSLEKSPAIKASVANAEGDGHLPPFLASGHLAFDSALALSQPVTVPAYIIGDLQSTDLGVEHPALAGEGLGVWRNVIKAQTPDFIVPHDQFLRKRFGSVRHTEILPFCASQFLCCCAKQAVFKRILLSITFN